MLAAQGRYEEALRVLAQAVSARPSEPAWHNEAGKILMKLHRPDQAAMAFRMAVTLAPGYFEAFYNLGTAYQEKGQMPEAVAAYRQAIVLRPDYAEAFNNLGNALLEMKDYAGAADALQRAIVLMPGFAPAHYNLGCVMYDSGQVDASVEQFHKSISMDPNLPEAWCSLGNALKDQGQYDESIAAMEKAMALRPDYLQARWNLGHLLLLRGDFERGWPLYELRWQKENATKGVGLSQPLWDGSPLNGRRILLHFEQGFGDMIQFARYAPLLATQGGRVIVAVMPPLRRLFQTLPGIEQVVSPGDPMPEIDLHYPAMSLPALLGISIETIPRNVPYLFADSKLAESWKSQLQTFSPKFNVGLVWAGNPGYFNDRNRSIPLAVFSSLAKCQQVRYFSLQKGSIRAEEKTPPAGMEWVDWTQELHDFADTAALIANLDLVITCDTAVSHLAGAMGRPVWTLLPFAPDWRWMLERSDSPWYPTMHLFRQPRPGDWNSVLRDVASELDKLSSK